MGRVTVAAVIENLDDLTSERLGQLPSASVRKVEVSDALVDSGATGLLMPKHRAKEAGGAIASDYLQFAVPLNWHSGSRDDANDLIGNPAHGGEQMIEVF